MKYFYPLETFNRIMKIQQLIFYKETDCKFVQNQVENIN
jgi:hypothetical protein